MLHDAVHRPQSALWIDVGILTTPLFWVFHSWWFAMLSASHFSVVSAYLLSLWYSNTVQHFIIHWIHHDLLFVCRCAVLFRLNDCNDSTISPMPLILRFVKFINVRKLARIGWRLPPTTLLPNLPCSPLEAFLVLIECIYSIISLSVLSVLILEVASCWTSRTGDRDNRRCFRWGAATSSTLGGGVISETTVLACCSLLGVLVLSCALLLFGVKVACGCGPVVAIFFWL